MYTDTTTTRTRELASGTVINSNVPLDANPLQLPLDRGRAKPAPPLIRGGWEGFEPNIQSGIYNPCLSVFIRGWYQLLPGTAP